MHGRAPSPASFIMLRIPYALLIPVALFMALAPLGQTSHLVEKLRMLSSGTLQRPIDIFDLVLHSTPLVLLPWKGVTDIRARRGPGKTH